MNGNDFVSWLLRSPLHSLLGRTMLITVTGKKTGKRYTLPVGYFIEEGDLWVLSSRDRHWWRNLEHESAVKMLMDGRQVRGRAEAVLDCEAVKRKLASYLLQIPQAARALGVRIENGTPNAGDIAHAAEGRLFVRIRTS